MLNKLSNKFYDLLSGMAHELLNQSLHEF